MEDFFLSSLHALNISQLKLKINWLNFFYFIYLLFIIMEDALYSTVQCIVTAVGQNNSVRQELLSWHGAW